MAKVRVDNTRDAAFRATTRKHRELKFGLLGLLWLVSPAVVFLIGSGIALLSLLLSLNVPTEPTPGNEVVVGLWGAPRRMATESR